MILNENELHLEMGHDKLVFGLNTKLLKSTTNVASSDRHSGTRNLVCPTKPWKRISHPSLPHPPSVSSSVPPSSHSLPQRDFGHPKSPLPEAPSSAPTPRPKSAVGASGPAPASSPGPDRPSKQVRSRRLPLRGSRPFLFLLSILESLEKHRIISQCFKT